MLKNCKLDGMDGMGLEISAMSQKCQITKSDQIYQKRPLCINFMLKKPCLKVNIFQYIIGWIGNDPPFRTFPKILPFW